MALEKLPKCVPEVSVADKKPEGLQIPAIAPYIPYVQQSFDLSRMDSFVKSLGSTFYHWKATPSPIGLNDRGDYRRNNNVDVMTSNGYIYSFGGKFTATMTGNQKDQQRPSQGGLIDSSTAYLVLPRFYDNASDVPVNGSNGLNSSGSDDCNSNGGCVTDETSTAMIQGCATDTSNSAANQVKDRIRLTPGDRLYSDPTIDDLVVNKELMNYSYNKKNVPMFPIVKMDAPIVDSRGVFYRQGIEFTIDCEGNIEWTEGAANPGIDPDTGEGRTYSVRYLYRAFYYVTSILREVRITEVTEGDVRRPERMPMYVAVQREYLYHNINRGNELNPAPQKGAAQRQVPLPASKIEIDQGVVLVEMTDLLNEE